ncbi:MAG: type II toxin-antitoxin system RelE/ParE family toxin [Rhodospirillales bacterium]|nr:type II toxin-antitoxin system RelE/ParE family toxin [Rhodospirillales bacterium]
MIRPFHDKDARRLFEGDCPRKWLAMRAQAERKRIQLESAATLDFLRAPPGNRLERLSGDRQGQWSIRINDRWRLCFTWFENGADDVEIVDYH